MNNEIEDLEQRLLQYVSFKSLGIAKMLYLESENIDENPLEILSVYKTKLEDQLYKKNNLGIFVDRCVVCNQTKLLDQWGEWEYVAPVLHSDGYCSPECMSVGTGMTMKEAYRIWLKDDS